MLTQLTTIKDRLSISVTYQVFIKIKLLPSVETTLKSYERWLV